MILDERNEFADATSVAGAAGTALIGDVMDLGPANVRDIGNGQQIYLVIQAETEIITGGAAGTIEFILASDAQAAIAVDGSATIHSSTGAIATNVAASNDPRLNAGAYIYVGVIPQGAAFERYLGVLAKIATTAVNAGKINAFLTLDVSAYRSYAENVPA